MILSKLGKVIVDLDSKDSKDLPDKVIVTEKGIMYILRKVTDDKLKINLLMKPSIRLHKDKNWIGFMIRLITRSPFNHVSANIRDTSRNNKLTTVESLPDIGVDHRPYILTTYPLAVKVIMTTRDNDDSTPLEFNVSNFMDTLESKKYEYNIFELLKFLLPWSIRKYLDIFKINRGYFCSELIVDMLMKFNIIRHIFAPNKYCPADFLPKEDNELHKELNAKFDYHLLVRPRTGGVYLYKICKIF